jgi:hypothetical protein
MVMVIGGLSLAGANHGQQMDSIVRTDDHLSEGLASVNGGDRKPLRHCPAVLARFRAISFEKRSPE